MQMSPTLAARFNRQITLELAASIAYLQMAAYMEAQSLTGMASWMRIQSAEEKHHADLFLQFVLDRGNEVAIGDITAPRSNFTTPNEVFESALDQEREVTKAIKELYDAAQAENDVSALPLLQTFLTEQVEEEATVGEIIDRLALAGTDGTAILQIDRELGTRTAE